MFDARAIRPGLTLLALIGLTGPWAAEAEFSTPNMAVYGCSLSTGAAANPRIQADMISLLGRLSGGVVRLAARSLTGADFRRHLETSIWDFRSPLYFGISPDLPQPTRIWWTDSVLERDGTELVDTEVYSWPYLLSQKLGIPAKDLLIAARDGQRVSALADQAGRVLKHTQGVLPERNFVLFSGNDLCSRNVYQSDVRQLADQYRQNLLRGLRLMVKESRPHQNGSLVYVMEFLDVLQTIDNPEVLKTTIPFHGARVTCRDVRYELNTRPDLKRKLDRVGTRLINILQAGCPSVQPLNPDNKEKIAYMREVQNVLRSAQRQAVEEIQAELPPGYQVRFLPTAHVIFGEGDVGNDCFHPSVRGLEKIARGVYEALDRR